MVGKRDYEIARLKAQLTEVTQGTRSTPGVLNKLLIKNTRLKNENAQLKDENVRLKITNDELIIGNHSSVKLFDQLFISSSVLPTLLV